MGGAGMTGTGTVSALPTVLGPVLPTPQMPMHPQVIHFISFSNLTNHFIRDSLLILIRKQIQKYKK